MNVDNTSVDNLFSGHGQIFFSINNAMKMPIKVWLPQKNLPQKTNNLLNGGKN